MSYRVYIPERVTSAGNQPAGETIPIGSAGLVHLPTKYKFTIKKSAIHVGKCIIHACFGEHVPWIKKTRGEQNDPIFPKTQVFIQC